MTVPRDDFCEVCDARASACLCYLSREPAIGQALGRSPARDELPQFGCHLVIVGGQSGRMVRQGDGGLVVYFDDVAVPPFAANGLPSAVLALAAEHVRKYVA
jgi:hypothetical protein